MQPFRACWRAFAVFAVASAALMGGATGSLSGVCGPFTDVTTFCSEVLEIYYLGLTTGTTATTYDPASNVSRLQMAIFLSRSADRLLQRGSRRAALKQFWTSQNAAALSLTTVGANPFLVESDGADLWVANGTSGTVSRVRGSDGKLLETWTGAASAVGVLVAMGSVFVTGFTLPTGRLYQIDPGQPAGAVTTVASGLGLGTFGIAFDGSRIWTANGNNSSVSIVTPGATIPWTVTTVTTGFSGAYGALYDGANIWVTNQTGGTLVKLDGSGAILQTVTVGGFAYYPVFDGTNIWVPGRVPESVHVVRASSGAILATLTGNGLNGATVAAFDGQRILVTDELAGGNVSLWKAADLTSLGFFPTGGINPYGACSDGVNFWITLAGSGKLARF